MKRLFLLNLIKIATIQTNGPTLSVNKVTCSNDLKNLCVVYLDREMFLLSTSFKQLSNLIVHYHLAKIVNGYTQQVQITGLIFGDNVFASRNLSKNQNWKCKNKKLLVQWSSLPTTASTLSNLVKCNCKKNSCDSSRCSCIRQIKIIPCTDLCQCMTCSNMFKEK